MLITKPFVTWVQKFIKRDDSIKTSEVKRYLG